MQRIAVGRIVGGAGAAAAMVAWGIASLSTIAYLMTPKRGLEGLGVIFVIPAAPIACGMCLVSTLALFALARRADRTSPWLLAAMHGLVALAAWTADAPALLLGSLAVVATQLVALRCFQMMPSQPSSQR